MAEICGLMPRFCQTSPCVYRLLCVRVIRGFESTLDLLHVYLNHLVSSESWIWIC